MGMMIQDRLAQVQEALLTLGPLLSAWHVVDRSRYETQKSRCERLRWVEYHAGPFGYGIRRTKQSLPLATGTMIHEVLGMIGRSAQASGGQLEDQDVRRSLDEAHREYHRSVMTSGMVAFGGEELLPLIEEQQNLVTGLTWAVVLHVIRPWLLEGYEVVAVEQDLPYIVGCSCGAGDQHGYGVLSLQAHMARGCQETASLFMSRPDLVLRHKVSGQVAYVEYKTTSSVGERFLTEWPTKIQFALGGLAVEANLGVEVDEYWVMGLNKGYRQGEYNPSTKKYDGSEKQRSIACYGYRKPGDPPVSQEEWAPHFNYTDEWGVGRRLGKGFVKTSVSDYPAQPGELPAESWIKSLQPGVRQELVVAIGPLNPRKVMLEKLAAQIGRGELEWRGKLWELYQGAEKLEGPPTEDPTEYWEAIWQQPAYQQMLDQLFPQSFDCRRYGERYKCAAECLCFYEGGWDRPISQGGFGWRTPHHSLEQVQMAERGLVVGRGDEGEELGN